MAVEVAKALVVIHDAVQRELSARGSAPPRAATSVEARPDGVWRGHLGEVAYAQCPADLRDDLTDGCRALAATLHTAGVFHLYRVWDGLHIEPPPVLRPDGSTVPDPRLHPRTRCARSDAILVLLAIRRRLEDRHP
jgi:hypothetical protein